MGATFRILFLLVLCSAAGAAWSQTREASTDGARSEALEVRVLGPVFWKKYCLEVNVKRTNRSKSPIFLPANTGVQVLSSVTDATNTLKQGPGVAWVAVYGLSDIIDYEVIRLAPGESRVDCYCISDTFAIVNSATEVRRQVPLRGMLRISASYLREAPRWQLSRSQREDMARTTPPEWKNVDWGNGGTLTAEIRIPCPEINSRPGCDSPPPIFADEHPPPIPDLGK